MYIHLPMQIDVDFNVESKYSFSFKFN